MITVSLLVYGKRESTCFVVSAGESACFVVSGGVVFLVRIGGVVIDADFVFPGLILYVTLVFLLFLLKSFE